MSILKEMINVRKFGDFGTIYWILFIKTILGIMAVVLGAIYK